MRELHPSSILHIVARGRVVSAKGRLRPIVVALAAAFVSVASTHDALAQCAETQFQNFTGGGQVVCPCFVPNEQAGAVFTLPANVYPIEIVKIGVGWGSQIGGAPQSLEEAIHIYAGGLPNPGSPIFSLVGPVLTDGGINEFNIEFVPGNKIINSGPFTVTLEFNNMNAGDVFAPSVVHDGNGCQSGRNVIYAVPGGWLNACAAGVTGDWVFYVKYRSVKVTGAAAPVRTVFSEPPVSQTSCQTVFVVNNGCGVLNIRGINGCGNVPFSVDTTATAHAVAPGTSTPIGVCVTPSGAMLDSCVVTVVSNASNGPITFKVVADVTATAVDFPAMDGFAIVGVVPNPFNPSTMVRFTLPRALEVDAEIWSVTGSRVRTLAAGRAMNAGEHSLRWDGRNADGARVASGVYLFRVSTPIGSRVARMVLVQ